MADIVFYAQQADAMSRRGLRTQSYAAGKLIRAYVTIKRYKPRARECWETNVYGRPCYMGEKAHAIFAATLAELDAGRELHTSTIAHLTGASQGYVTKVLKFLHRFHFIEVLEVKRGRYGGILARLARAIRQSFLHPRRNVSIWRNDYHRTDPRYTDPFGSWSRSLARMGLSDA